MTTIDWYFDFISPFSYLQTFRLAEVPEEVEIVTRPVLFAGILDHWGATGPAELPPKRIYTYRYCTWLANRMGVPFRMPPAHPFNPLRALRLAIVLRSRVRAVDTIFRAIWQEGHLPDDEHGWRSICTAVGVPDADELIGDPEVKRELRANGERAIAAGVFGVPTVVLNQDGGGGDAESGEPGQGLFWGLDATDFLLDALRDPAVLNDPEMTRIAALPSSAHR